MQAINMPQAGSTAQVLNSIAQLRLRSQVSHIVQSPEPSQTRPPPELESAEPVVRSPVVGLEVSSLVELVCAELVMEVELVGLEGEAVVSELAVTLLVSGGRFVVPSSLVSSSVQELESRHESASRATGRKGPRCIATTVSRACLLPSPADEHDPSGCDR